VRESVPGLIRTCHTVGWLPGWIPNEWRNQAKTRQNRWCPGLKTAQRGCTRCPQCPALIRAGPWTSRGIERYREVWRGIGADSRPGGLSLLVDDWYESW